jgi:hypothetical protein
LLLVSAKSSQNPLPARILASAQLYTPPGVPRAVYEETHGDRRRYHPRWLLADSRGEGRNQRRIEGLAEKRGAQVKQQATRNEEGQGATDVSRRGRSRLPRPDSAQRRGASRVRASDRLSERPARLRHRSHRAPRVRRCGRAVEYAVADRCRCESEGQDRARELSLRCDLVKDS